MRISTSHQESLPSQQPLTKTAEGATGRARREGANADIAAGHSPSLPEGEEGKAEDVLVYNDSQASEVHRMRMMKYRARTSIRELEPKLKVLQHVLRLLREREESKSVTVTKRGQVATHEQHGVKMELLVDENLAGLHLPLVAAANTKDRPDRVARRSLPVVRPEHSARPLVRGSLEHILRVTSRD